MQNDSIAQAATPLEWTGVTEIVDQKREALYRANVTSAVALAFFVIVYILLPWVDDQTKSFPVLPTFFFFFVGLISVMWIVSFVLGYYGITLTTGSSPVMGTTRNSDLSPRANDILIGIWPWAPRFRKPGWERKTIAYDFILGKLFVSPSGVSGIISFPLSDITSISSMNAQTVEIKGIERIFSLRFGSKKAVLHFVKPEDAASFLEAIKNMRSAGVESALSRT